MRFALCDRLLGCKDTLVVRAYPASRRREERDPVRVDEADHAAEVRRESMLDDAREQDPHVHHAVDGVEDGPEALRRLAAAGRREKRWMCGLRYHERGQAAR